LGLGFGFILAPAVGAVLFTFYFFLPFYPYVLTSRHILQVLSFDPVIIVSP